MMLGRMSEGGGAGDGGSANSSPTKSKSNPTNALDEVIKRRLLIDGDGVGDDRRIHNLLKNILSWASSDEKTGDEQITYRRLLSQIHQIEHSVRRTYGIIQTTTNAGRLYTEVQSAINQEILKTEQVIEISKTELEEETKHRKHSMEYEALTKLIETKQDRQATERKQETLEEDVQNLSVLNETLDDKLLERQKSVNSLAFAVQTLRDLVAEDERECEDLNSETYQSIPTEPLPMETGSVPPPTPAPPVPSTSIFDHKDKDYLTSTPRHEQLDLNESMDTSLPDEFMGINVKGFNTSLSYPSSPISDSMMAMMGPPAPAAAAPISPEPLEPLLDDSIDEGEILDSQKKEFKDKYEDLSEESPEEGESED